MYLSLPFNYRVHANSWPPECRLINTQLRLMCERQRPDHEKATRMHLGGRQSNQPNRPSSAAEKEVLSSAMSGALPKARSFVLPGGLREPIGFLELFSRCRARPKGVKPFGSFTGVYQRPLKSGSRFSRKASMPSLKSSLRKRGKSWRKT